MSSRPSSIILTMAAAFLQVGGVSPPAAAQAPSGEAAEAAGAEAVARAAIAALAEARWADVADLVHPVALERIRTSALGAARTEERHRDTEFVIRRDMPEAVAEWFDEQARKYREEYGSPLEARYGVASIEELEALSPRDFFSRWLESNDPIVQLRANVPEVEQAALDHPGIRAHFRVEREVIGSVVEGDSVAHVMYRPRSGPLGPVGSPLDEAPGVLTLRRVADRWALWPTDQPTSLFGPSPFIMLSSSTVDPAAVAERVVVWPDEDAPVGRAYVVGYTGEDEPPRGLEVEVMGADGEPIRVEIPVSAFAELLEVLGHWAHGAH